MPTQLVYQTFHFLRQLWKKSCEWTQFMLEQPEYYLLQNHRLDTNAHKQTIIRRQLFAGQVVGSGSMKGMKK